MCIYIHTYYTLLNLYESLDSKSVLSLFQRLQDKSGSPPLRESRPGAIAGKVPMWMSTAVSSPASLKGNGLGWFRV